MSGYGFASVVVEAGENSDARIQARLAVEHGRPVVLLRAVVEATAWARRLMDQPGVYVAGDAGDALGIVDDLRRDPAEADRLLSTLAVGAS
jgi:DNA processing protein